MCTFDGQRPSMVFGRGILYPAGTRGSWDWRNGALTQRWAFDSNIPATVPTPDRANQPGNGRDVDGDKKMRSSMAQVVSSIMVPVKITAKGMVHALHMI